MKNIGSGRQVEQRSVLSDNDHAVDQNLTNEHVLLDFNLTQRNEFWSVHRLVCNIAMFCRSFRVTSRIIGEKPFPLSLVTYTFKMVLQEGITVKIRQPNNFSWFNRYCRD